LFLSVSLLISVIVANDSLNLFFDNDSEWFAPIDFFNFLSYPLLAFLCLCSFIFIEYKSLAYLRKQFIKDENSNQNVFISVLIFSIVFIGFTAIVNDGFKFWLFYYFPAKQPRLLFVCMSPRDPPPPKAARGARGLIQTSNNLRFFAGEIIKMPKCPENLVVSN